MFPPLTKYFLAFSVTVRLPFSTVPHFDPTWILRIGRNRPVLNKGNQGMWCCSWPNIAWLTIHCGQYPPIFLNSMRFSRQRLSSNFSTTCLYVGYLVDVFYNDGLHTEENDKHCLELILTCERFIFVSVRMVFQISRLLQGYWVNDNQQ